MARKARDKAANTPTVDKLPTNDIDSGRPPADVSRDGDGKPVTKADANAAVEKLMSDAAREDRMLADAEVDAARKAAEGDDGIDTDAMYDVQVLRPFRIGLTRYTPIHTNVRLAGHHVRTLGDKKVRVKGKVENKAGGDA